MVKGISRQVIVVDAPDSRYFDQAIFILSTHAEENGVSREQLVEQAVRIANSYVRGHSGAAARRIRLSPLTAALLGGAAVGVIWLAVTLLC